MADVTLSPIPYNSGTLGGAVKDVSHIHLGSDRFCHAAHQSTPNYLFLYTSQLTNVKTGTFSSTIPKARAVLDGTTLPGGGPVNYVRLCKLTASRVLCAVNGSIFVFDIDANGEFIRRTGKLDNFGPAHLGGRQAAAPTGAFVGTAMGVSFGMFYARDNVAYCWMRSGLSASTTVKFYKLVFDDGADTLTATQIGADIVVNVSAATAMTRVLAQSIPGSSKIVVSLRSWAAGESAYIGKAWVVDPTNDTWTEITTFPTTAPTVKVLVPLRENLILGLVNASQFLTWAGTGWNTSVGGYSPGEGSVHKVWHAVALDDTYFMVFCAGNTAAANDLNSQQDTSVMMMMRVCRYVDPSLGQSSDNTKGTASTSGVSLGVAAGNLVPVWWQWDHASIVRPASDVVYLIGTAAIAAGSLPRMQVRTLYQPAA